MFSNKNNLSLPLSVFMVHSDYDNVLDPNYISATSLLQPLKSIILSNTYKSKELDVIDLLASSVGTASHDRLEKSFLHDNHIINLRKLGYSDSVISRVKINPESIESDDIPIYLEKRTIKELNGWKIGGKFDFVSDGIVRDLKTTKTYKWIKQDFEDYILQGSIYRWLNQDIITANHMYIDFIFTDWKKYESDANPDYPRTPAISKKLSLMSIEDTENWLINRLNSIEKYLDSPQDQLPICNEKELWQDPPKYAYFKNPTGKRATKVYNSLSDANNKLIQDGNVGKVDTRLGKPTRCNYCLKSICTQAQEYIKQGLLEE